VRRRLPPDPPDRGHIGGVQPTTNRIGQQFLDHRPDKLLVPSRQDLPQSGCSIELAAVGRHARWIDRRAELARIVEIQLGHLRARLAAKRIEVEVSDAAKALLAREGYDPTYGARPLKRTIQRLVQDPLALKLLEREFAEGDTVVVDAEHDTIVFRRSVSAQVRD